MLDPNDANTPNTVVIWNADQGIADNHIDLAVQEKVIIGGTGTLTPQDPGSDPTHPNYGYMNTDILLHVHGDAIKSQGGATWRVASDARYKKDVKPFTDGLEKIREIKPVTFRYNGNFGIGGDNIEVGVIAQELQPVLPYMISEDTISHTIKTKELRRYEVEVMDSVVSQTVDYSVPKEHGEYPSKDTTIYRMVKKWVIDPAEYREEKQSLLTYNPNALFYLLINSVKQLDSNLVAVRNESAIKLNDASRVNDSLRFITKILEERIARLEANSQISLDEAADVILEQNNPNPFAESTLITYYIPDRVQGNAELIVSPTSQSPILQRYPLTKGLPTQMSVSAHDLYTGVFVYSIVANGKVLASKKFIIIK